MDPDKIRSIGWSSLIRENDGLKATKRKKSAKGTGARRKRRIPEEIKGRLLRAAVEEFKRHGYAATTAAIADRADVTEGQLYRYFGSKTELIREAVFKPLNKELSDFCVTYLAQITAMDDKRERIRTYIKNLQDFVGEHSELLTALTALHPARTGDRIDVNELSSLSLYFDTGAIMLESRYKNAWIRPRLVAKIVFSSVLSTVMFKDWMFSSDTESEEEILDTIGEFLINAIHVNSSSRE